MVAPELEIVLSDALEVAPLVAAKHSRSFRGRPLHPLNQLASKESWVIKLWGLKSVPSTTRRLPMTFLKNSFISLTWIESSRKGITNATKMQFGLPWRSVFILLNSAFNHSRFIVEFIASQICHYQGLLRFKRTPRRKEKRSGDMPEGGGRPENYQS